MKKFGIDVSVWQGNYDFNKAKKEEVKFVILKGASTCPGLGGGKDSTFESNYKKAKSAGLGVGVYQYTYAESKEQAVQEADWFYDNCIKGKQFDYPIYIDIEDQCQSKMGKRVATDIVKAWVDRIRSKNCYAAVYSYYSFFKYNLYDSELQYIDHWVAQYTSNCTYMPTTTLKMWQYGGDTNCIRSPKVAGVITDQNYCYVDYPTIIKNGGYNGYPKTVNNSKEHSITGYDIQRKTDYLVVYTKGESTKTNKYGTEFRINNKGVVLNTPVYGEGNMALKGCWVVSGHGEASTWIKNHIANGKTVEIIKNKIVVK